MIPQSRDDFKAFILRTLGDGVLQINVSDEQVEDRIDQAFYMYQQYHMDATVKTFLKHEITPSVMSFTSAPTTAFQNSEMIIGQTSNAHGQVVAPAAVLDANAITMFGTSGPVAYMMTGPSSSQAGDGKPFLEGEMVVGDHSGAAATIAVSGDLMIFQTPFGGNWIVGESLVDLTTNSSVMATYVSTVNATAIVVTTHLPSVVGHVLSGATSGANGIYANVTANGFKGMRLGDMDLKYVTMPPSVIAVNRILGPFESRIFGDILFNPQAQFEMSLMANFTSMELNPYVIGRQYEQLLNDTFRGKPSIRYSRHQGRVYVDVDWFKTFLPHSFLIFDAFVALDPADAVGIWSDRWLQDYATALVKKQWGMNMMKFSGVALPGGITLDGTKYIAMADVEILALEEQLRTTYQLPIDFMTG